MKTYYHNILETFNSFDRRQMKVYDNEHEAIKEFNYFMRCACHIEGDTVKMIQTTMIGDEITSVDVVREYVYRKEVRI